MPTLAFGFLPIPRKDQNDRRSLTGCFCSVFDDSFAILAGTAFLGRTLANLLVEGFFRGLVVAVALLRPPSFFASASVKTFVLPSKLPNFFYQAPQDRVSLPRSAGHHRSQR